MRFVTQVGGLWRDETNSVNMANLASFREMWGFLDYDSFPILFFAILRGWSALSGMDNDAGLRAFGCLMGLGILATLFWNARSLGARWPVLSLALVGLNPMIIRYGDSVRAYGLGMILILLTFRAFWRIVDPTTPLTARRVGLGLILALLSVHTLYYNSVLLLAIAAGACAVALRAGDWRRIGVVLGIGLIAALSLLPYVPMMQRMREWTFLVSYPADLAWIWKRLGEVTGSPDPFGVWIFAGLFVAGVSLVAMKLGATALRRFRASANAAPERRELPDAVLFAGVAAVVGVIGYISFLDVLNYYTAPWYYVALVAFTSCALDVLFGAWQQRANTEGSLSLVLRSARALVAVAVLGLSGTAAWNELTIRHTNLDQVAARLQPLTTKGDLILVPRWECAITLSRYYRGPATIATLPPIDDHRFHRYDLYLAKLLEGDDAVQPVLEKMEEALRSGGRVFVVGALPFPPADAAEPVLPPMRRGADGTWQGAAPTAKWYFRAGQLLVAHATHAGDVEVPLSPGTRVQGYENLRIMVARGWQ